MTAARKSAVAMLSERLRGVYDADEKKRKWEECKKERDDAFESIGKTQDECDKQLLTLSVGFLAFILAFIKDVVPLDEAIWLSLLLATCIMLLLCIITVLVSFRVSIAGHYRVMDYYEEQMDGKDSEFPMGFVKAIRRLNGFATVLFGAGVFCCILFVMLNVSHGAKMGNDRLNEGREIKGPLGPAPNDLEKARPIKVPVKPFQPQNPAPAQTGGGSGKQK